MKKGFAYIDKNAILVVPFSDGPIQRTTQDLNKKKLVKMTQSSIPWHQQVHVDIDIHAFPNTYTIHWETSFIYRGAQKKTEFITEFEMLSGLSHITRSQHVFLSIDSYKRSGYQYNNSKRNLWVQTSGRDNLYKMPVNNSQSTPSFTA